jgi:hypothetical protein
MFLVDAGGATDFLEYSVDSAPEARGTLVFRDWNLAMNDASSGFSGVIVVTGTAPIREDTTAVPASRVSSSPAAT